LGTGDQPQFSRLGVGAEVSGPRALEVDGGNLSVNNGYALQLRSANNTYSGTITKDSYNATIDLSHNGRTALSAGVGFRFSCTNAGGGSVDLDTAGSGVRLIPRTPNFSLNVGALGAFSISSIG